MTDWSSIDLDVRLPDEGLNRALIPVHLARLERTPRW